LRLDSIHYLEIERLVVFREIDAFWLKQGAVCDYWEGKKQE
jgi:hypothetical protein